MTKRACVSLWLVTVSSLCILAGAIATSASAQSVLRFSTKFEPPLLDPVASSLTMTQNHGHLIYDTLFSLGCDGVSRPQMVKDYSVKTDEKGAVWTLSLRDGLKFHDGTPVRSADAIASIKRWSLRDIMGKKLNEIGMTFAEVDDRSFTITMPVETPLIINALGKGMSSIPFVMRASDAALPINQPVKERIGSGPFKFVEAEYKKGHQMIYERNKEYVPRDEPPDCFAGGKVVKVDRVAWLVMPDAATGVSALMNDEIDLLEGAPLDLIPVLKSNPNIAVQKLSDLGLNAMVRFNFNVPPFDNSKGRLGLIKLFSQKDALAVLAGNDPDLQRTCYSFLGCGGPNELEPADKRFSHDVQEGKRLLKEAGYKGEPIVMFSIGDDEGIRKMGAYVAEVLRSAGVNVKVQMMDYGTLMQKRNEKTGWGIYPVWMQGNQLDNPLSNLALADGCGANAFPGWACSPEINRLKDEWAREANSGRAKELIRHIGEAAIEHMPYVSLGVYEQPMVFRKTLKGVPRTTMPVLWGIEKSK